MPAFGVLRGGAMRQKNNRRVRRIVPGSLVKGGQSPMDGTNMCNVDPEHIRYVARGQEIYSSPRDVGVVLALVGRSAVVLWSRDPASLASNMMLHSSEKLIGIATP